MTDKIKIMLVDDHDIVRDGVKAIIAGTTDIEVVAEASSVAEALNTLEKSIPDVIILDISLPDKSGIEAIPLVHQIRSSLPVLILSMHNNEEYIIRAIKAGARGYLPKNIPARELTDAIRRIFVGEEYFGEATSVVLRKALMRKLEKEEKNETTSEPLSQRENEVLQLFCAGLSNQEMADKLFISIRTVETHKTHIMQKLGLKTTVELIKYAIRNKIIDI
ncbi:MAG: response regulator [Bacteroidales bacterium]